MCTPDHDVLTERGWVPIAAVTTADRVACLGAPLRRGLNGFELEYRSPAAVVGKFYDDELITIRNDTHSLRVAPGQPLRVKLRGRDAPKAVAAEDVWELFADDAEEKRYRAEPAALLTSRAVNVRPQFTGYPARPGWLELWGILAMYGHMDDHETIEDMWDFWPHVRAPTSRALIVYPPESEYPWNRRAEVVFDLIQGLNLNFRVKDEGKEAGDHHDASFTIGDETAHDMQQMIADKEGVPDFAWQLSMRQVKRMIGGYTGWLGDATEFTIRRSVLSTASPAMAGKLQRLALHAGVMATTADSLVSFGFDDNNSHAATTTLFAAEPYRGRVHSLKMPGSAHYYVRRDGKPSWIGSD